MIQTVLTTSRDAADVAAWFAKVRRATVDLTAGLTAEDQQVQSMPDASPTKWHLAHSTWFFETFLLVPHLADYRPFDPDFSFLFNSYYEQLGERHPRPSRGLLTRPGLAAVLDYRAHVDEAMSRLLGAGKEAVAELTVLGLHHEQQHQELILMDIKHLFGMHPLLPAYAEGAPAPHKAADAEWHDFDGGLTAIGHEGGGFHFDNEGPRHTVWLEPYRLCSRAVTQGEWLQFIQDGGYHTPGLWLSDGWAAAAKEGWAAPLYWRQAGGEWRVFGLHGLRPLDPEAPVLHVSHYEADAYARWCGRRLPTEMEWEGAMAARPALAASIGGGWEWTASAYLPYPRYRPPEGAIGEYNGKFMSGQMVLRGAAAATSEGHSRLTYRNFFPPAARWAFSTVRLADDA